jgi:hypothetical protein
VTVTSANTLAPGAIIVISGTTSYNGTFTVVSATATTFTITAPFVADDATGVWIAGGGVIADCTTTGATGVVSLPAMTAVAAGLPALRPCRYSSMPRQRPAPPSPFHELLYTWNFGDPGQRELGLWQQGRQ